MPKMGFNFMKWFKKNFRENSFKQTTNYLRVPSEATDSAIYLRVPSAATDSENSQEEIISRNSPRKVNTKLV